MFDPVTAAFIRNAPALPGLNPADLVDELTSAYIDIASARLDAGQSSDTKELINRMSRLADIYEGQVVLGLNSDQRRPAAFVAASARQVIAQVLQIGVDDDTTTRLDEHVIGAEIAAAVLFLIAERSSDAYEAARSIRAAGEPNAIRRALILALGRFARGQFSEIAEMDVATERLGGLDDFSYAADLLFRELLEALKLLAEIGLGEASEDAIEAAQTIFERVKALSIDTSVDDATRPDAPIAATSIFAGPHHLAALLARASRTLLESMVVRTPTPHGANDERWGQWLRSEAKRWPFLWENHRNAISTGYLNQGSSLVMTTPTGSGKTTLARLKITATLTTGKTVLYLAPTHALVGQVERDLNERIAGLAKAENIEEITLDEAVQGLPDLAVVTPERCFALLTFAPQLFGNVGLLVFDECHLLGVSRPGTDTRPPRIDRRGIDAMLCLLTFMTVNSTADYLLLSAMVSNAGEVAEWLRGVLGRPVYAFEDKWKPTRQLRSCIVYSDEDIRNLNRSLWATPPPASVSATPHGLFSLASGWNPNAPDRLVVRPFAQGPVLLSKGQNSRSRWLTSNRYEVAATIADPFAIVGLKVIVFCESITACVSVAKKLNARRETFALQWNEEQNAWRSAAIGELGNVEAIYDAGTMRAAVHHGELLPDERRLVETLFRDRESGINILAATSTLAQGLNLPCDIVILASTDRLDDSDPEEKSRSQLMPHEILNALGRAGRAGYAATGVSVVVPGAPIPCNLGTNVVANEDILAVVFSEGDQCLPLADPLTALYDQIEISGVSGDEAQYLLRRLATSLGNEREGVETFDSLTRRSFGFYQKARINPTLAEDWLSSRKTALTAVLQSSAPLPALPWQEELAAKTGASAGFVIKLASAYTHAPKNSVDAVDWIVWLIEQLDPADEDFDTFLRADILGRVFGRAYTAQQEVEARRKVGLKGVMLVLSPWFEGKPLIDIEAEIATFIAANEGTVRRPTRADPKAKRARRFALRLAPDLGFLCGLLNQIALNVAAGNEMLPPPMVGFLSQLVRRGFQTPYHFALSRDMSNASRPEIQQAFETVSAIIDRQPTDDWNTVREKLENAHLSIMFDDVSDDDG